MFKYNNTHIFTGYLKQLLSSVNIPACKIYTREFAEYFKQHGKEDPRIIESFDSINENRLSMRVNYLRDDAIYNYFWKYSSAEPNLGHDSLNWERVSLKYYDSDRTIHGLTKRLNSNGLHYDEVTHEYLGEYLRFLRDYHDVNLMSLYNCFNNKICNNINHTILLNDANNNILEASFNSIDPRYKIYAIPVKLFEKYTIAIDSSHGLELFCGFYNAKLDLSNRAADLMTKTYQKIHSTIFNQPFLYNKLDVQFWSFDNDRSSLTDSDTITRWDIINREQDLKLFIKVPAFCKSSIVIMEGDYRHYNDFKYNLKSSNIDKDVWSYDRNYSIINIDNKDNVNAISFSPIGKLQLLEFNTGESYPFADRLIEYLSGSAITPLDNIHDNIKRAQRVMKQNGHRFKIEGLWENKMQKIIYDYIINSGPIEAGDGKKLIDKQQGYHYRLGHNRKSTLYDTLGYIDRDAEKWYASWKNENGKAVMKDSIQSIDIYDGLYDV